MALSSSLARLATKLEVSDKADASNGDNQPLPPNKRTWNALDFFAVYPFMAFNCSVWNIGSSLLSLQLNVWQAVLAAGLATFPMLALLLVSGLEGNDWGIAEPHASRVVWGLRGFYFLLVVQVLNNLLYSSIQLYFGGQCLKVVIVAIAPSFEKIPDTLPDSTIATQDLIVIMIFFAISIPLHLLSTEGWKIPGKIAALSTAITLTAITVVCLAKAGGAGPLVSRPYAYTDVSDVPTGSRLAWAMLHGMTLYSSAIEVLQTSTITRLAKRPRAQFPAQISLIYAELAVVLFGILSASAAIVIFPDEDELLWSPYSIMLAFMRNGGSGARAACFFGGLALVSTQLGMQITGNGYYGGTNLTAALPKYLNIKRGAVIVACVGLLIQPWRLAGRPSSFVRTLTGIIILTGTAAGMLLADYFFVRKRKLELSDLYKDDGSSIYWYHQGVNFRALLVWLITVAPVLPGFARYASGTESVAPYGLFNLYRVSWYYCFATAAVLYTLACYIWPVLGRGETDEDVQPKNPPDKA